MIVSVVMPVYNGEAYLREAIDSILNQSFTDFEFIIINDCSTDGTEHIIESYSDERIVCLRNDKNQGVALSLNRGIDVSRGKYIARLDADDIARPERLKIQVEYMDLHPEVDVLATSSQSFDETGVLFEGHTSTDEDILKLDNFFSCALCHPTVMMRRDTLEKKNLRYDDAYNKVEDYDLWSRMLSLGCIIRSIDVILLDHRLHNNQVTSVYSQDMIDKLNRIHKRTLDEMGIEYTEGELTNLCAYGVRGVTTAAIDYRVLCGLLEKVLFTGNYSSKKMKKYCKSFAVAVLHDLKLPLRERIVFAKTSSFLSGFDALRYLLVGCVAKKNEE